MKICINCNNTLKDENKFCNQCGTPYVENAKTAAKLKGYTQIESQRDQAPNKGQPFNQRNQQQSEGLAEYRFSSSSGNINKLTETLYRFEYRHNNLINKYEEFERKIFEGIPEKLNKVNFEISKGDEKIYVTRRLLDSSKVDTVRARNEIKNIDRTFDEIKHEFARINVLSQIESFELKLYEMRERVQVIEKNINDKELIYKKSPEVLLDALNALEEKISKLEKSIPIVKPKPRNSI